MSALEITKRFEELRSKKTNVDNYAQVAAKYCHPQKARITIKQTEGERVSSEVYDSTAIDSAQISAAGLQAFLASPSSEWFDWEFEDPELNDEDEAQDWLHEERRGVYNTLNGSNFNNQFGEFCHDFVVLPCATLYSEPDPRDIIRFLNLPFEETYIDVNERGEVNELHRQYERTVKQVVERFPKTCGAEIQKLYDDGKHSEMVTLIHAVGERHVRDVAKKGSTDMAWYSCIVDVKRKRKLEEKGFQNFPFNVGRWRVNPGSIYAYTPATIGIADILMLNDMQKTLAMSGQQAVGPSWLFPHEDFILPLNMNNNSINYAIQSMVGNQLRDWKPMPLVSGANIPIGIELIQRMEQRIKNYFFTDLFLPLLEKQATAFEVAKVIEKRMTILGAVVGGLTKHVLEPVILQTYRMRRQHPALRGKLKPIPKIIKDGENVKINYISPLATAQKSTNLQNLEGWLYSVAQMAQVNPEVLDLIEWDKIVKNDAKMRSIDATLVRNQTDVDEIRAKRRKDQSDANALQMAALGGKALEQTGKGVKALAESGGAAK